jgi:hypothetical protein
MRYLVIARHRADERFIKCPPYTDDWYSAASIVQTVLTTYPKSDVRIAFAPTDAEIEQVISVLDMDGMPQTYLLPSQATGVVEPKDEPYHFTRMARDVNTMALATLMGRVHRDEIGGENDGQDAGAFDAGDFE